MLSEKSLKKLALIYTIIVLLVSVLPVNGSTSSLNNNYLVTIRLDYLFHAILYIPWIVLVWLAIGIKIRRSLYTIVGWVIFSLLFAFNIHTYLLKTLHTQSFLFQPFKEVGRRQWCDLKLTFPTFGK